MDGKGYDFISHTVQPNQTLYRIRHIRDYSERNYLELSLLYMKRRFNIYSIIEM